MFQRRLLSPAVRLGRGRVDSRCRLTVRQTSDEDTSQFDQRFTNQPPVDSPDDSHLSESANLVFEASTGPAQGEWAGGAKTAGGQPVTGGAGFAQ